MPTRSILVKALLGILYTGDCFAFVKEALHLQNTNVVLRVAGNGQDNMEACR
jgi:hypothetical protein